MKNKAKQKILDFLRENWDGFIDSGGIIDIVIQNLYQKVEDLGLTQKVSNYETILCDYEAEIIPSVDEDLGNEDMMSSDSKVVLSLDEDVIPVIIEEFVNGSSYKDPHNEETRFLDYSKPKNNKTMPKKSFNNIAEQKGLLDKKGKVYPDKHIEYNRLLNMFSIVLDEQSLDTSILIPDGFYSQYCFVPTFHETSLADYLISEKVLDKSYAVLDSDMFKVHKGYWEEFCEKYDYEEGLYEKINSNQLQAYESFISEDVVLGIGA